jgi:hypothetical protein
MSAVTPTQIAHPTLVLVPPTVPKGSMKEHDAMCTERMRLSSLSAINTSASHTRGEGDAMAEGREAKPVPPPHDTFVANSISNTPPLAPMRPDTADSYESAESGHRGSRAVQVTRGMKGGRGQYGSRSRHRSNLPRDTREEGEGGMGSDAGCEDGDSAEDDGDDDWVDTRSMMKSKSSRYVSSSSSSSLLLGKNAAPKESAQLAGGETTETSPSPASKVSGGRVGDIAVPAFSSKLELSLHCDLISDTAAPLQTESASVSDSIVLGSIVSVPPSNVLPILNGHIPLTDVVCVGQESQHQLSGSLLPGRSGVASKKKPAARALQPRAIVLDSVL